VIFVEENGGGPGVRLRKLKAKEEGFGDVTEASLPHFAKIAEAQVSMLEIAIAIGDRLTPPPGSDERLVSIVTRAAQSGDADAILLLKTGALHLLSFK
jgi:hypothetical protein